jgi:hypothetical protein
LLVARSSLNGEDQKQEAGINNKQRFSFFSLRRLDVVFSHERLEVGPQHAYLLAERVTFQSLRARAARTKLFDIFDLVSQMSLHLPEFIACPGTSKQIASGFPGEIRESVGEEGVFVGHDRHPLMVFSSSLTFPPWITEGSSTAAGERFGFFPTSREYFSEMLGQEDVFRPFAEGRNVNRHDVETVEEVFPESAFLDFVGGSLVAAIIRTSTFLTLVPPAGCSLPG